MKTLKQNKKTLTNVNERLCKIDLYLTYNEIHSVDDSWDCDCLLSYSNFKIPRVIGLEVIGLGGGAKLGLDFGILCRDFSGN